MSAAARLQELWALAGCDVGLLSDVTLSGQDPVLPSCFHVGEMALATIGAVGAASAAIWQVRTGPAQSVRVEGRAAAAMFRSEWYYTIDGERPPSPWGPVSGYYHTGDERMVQLHANFPHHEHGLVKLLDCEADKAAVGDALLGWKGEEFETVATERGLCVGLLRSRDEWLEHPQHAALADLPPLDIVKTGESAPEPFASGGERPLSGVNVLDFSRIIAGPVAGRTLAAHGADVLRLIAPHLPYIPTLWLDVARGKRSAFLDLENAADAARLHDLVSGCDVLLQAYRPGALAEKGLAPDQVQALRPGIVQVSLSAYGEVGPWGGKRGYDSLVQTTTGIGDAGARAVGGSGTRPLPCQALDHATGYLAAFGALVALQRRAIEGGSYAVRVSLARTAEWLWRMGLVEDGFAVADLTADDVADLTEATPTSEGVVAAIRPAEQLSLTPARWDRPPSPFGTHEPVWS